MEDNRAIRNSMEDALEVVLKRTLFEHPEYFKCTCGICLNDIRALTLNRLKPKYYSTDKGGAFTHMEAFGSQMQTDIQMELNKSIKRVEERPSHD